MSRVRYLDLLRSLMSSSCCWVGLVGIMACSRQDIAVDNRAESPGRRKTGSEIGASGTPAATNQVVPPAARSPSETSIDKYAAAKSSLEKTPPSFLRDMTEALGAPVDCHPQEGKDTLLCYWHFDAAGSTRVVSSSVGPAQERNDSPNAWVHHVHFVRSGVPDGSIEGGIMQRVGGQR